MKVQYTKKGDNRVEFSVKGVDFITANAIRRAIMTYVPSMAMEKVTVYENTSPIYEEMIAQRLGLIPLITDLKTYSLPDECKCGGKGCARCQASFILEKTGPATVYSGDLKSQDSEVKPVYDKIPITKLGNNQSVKMEMVARLGFMNEHAKFQSALASYKQLSDDEFEFFAETYNNIPAKEMVELGMAGMEARVEALADALTNAKHKRKSPAEKEEELPKELEEKKKKPLAEKEVEGKKKK